LSGSDADIRPLAAVHVTHVGEGGAVAAEARSPCGRLAEGSDYRVEVFLEGRNGARRQREVLIRSSGSCAGEMATYGGCIFCVRKTIFDTSMATLE
jgi:hypothetical protein